VHQWTGLEARALRRALRLSVRAFAERLGVAVRTVSKWEKLGIVTEPRPDTQAILDTALARADAATHLRFETLLSEDGRSGIAPERRIAQSGPRVWDHETWAEDLERTVVALSKQSFVFATNLLNRWLARWDPRDLDDKGLYLFARSTALMGDLRRDQGAVLGPLSAQHSYAGARSVFTQLEIPRRIAQLDLSLAVVAEMSGKLDPAAFGDPHAFTAAVDATLTTLKHLPAADGAPGVFYPGERSAELAATRTDKGIPVAPKVWRELTESAAKFGITPPGAA
jgi:transcriptional regulator with XRE-family HTH domain